MQRQRGAVLLSEARRAVAEQQAAAVCIQRSYRGEAGRRRVRAMSESHARAAAVIQSVLSDDIADTEVGETNAQQVNTVLCIAIY